MVVYIALLLLISVQGVLHVRGDYEAENKALARDEVSCYECGQSKLSKDKKFPTLQEKHNATPGDFPWHATIYYFNTTGELDYNGGGTLITSRAVITSVTCVTKFSVQVVELLDPHDLRVVLGKTTKSWDVTETSDIRMWVKEVRVHPDYTGATTNYANDIALIILDGEVSFSDVVMPACLSYNPKNLAPHKNGDIGYVSGFGYTEECFSICSSMSEQLHYTAAEVLNFRECYDKAQIIHLSTFVQLTSDKYCAGNGSASPIQKGDQGGGFTQIHNGLHYLTGVASIKLVKLGNQKFEYSFGALTNVSRHMDWIKENLPEEK